MYSIIARLAGNGPATTVSHAWARCQEQADMLCGGPSVALVDTQYQAAVTCGECLTILATPDCGYTDCELHGTDPVADEPCPNDPANQD